MEQIYYGFKKPPFSSEINTDEIFQSYDFKEAFIRLHHLKKERGLFLLTGEPGGGKTTLLRKFLSDLNPQIYRHGYTPHASVTRSDFYRQLSHLLGQKARTKKSDLFIQIQKAILDFYDNQGKIPCIILDECQLMDTLTLREISLITNFEMDSRHPFILILIAQPEFRDTLKRGIHESLNQRINMSYHMAGLDAKETENYIIHSLKVAGRTEPLFTKKATNLIYQMSNGLPRRIGNICKNSLIYGFKKKLKEIDEEAILKVKNGI
jgi:type II secretory pathway predicted ATPase ExeA